MIQTCYESVTSSALITFLVGCDEHRFTLHSGAICQWFPNLMVWQDPEDPVERSGGTLLGYCPEEDVFAWQHIERATFGRFAEFLYSGDYKAPGATLDLNKKPTKGPQRYRNWFSMAAYSRFCHDRVETGVASLDRDALWTLFKGLNYTLSDDADKESIPVEPNTVPQQSYVDVFLCHAKLFALAQEHSLRPLMRLTHDKLHRTLINFKLFEERMGDVVQLLRMCYENEHASGIRDVVVHYAACHAELLWGNREFVDLVGSNCELSQNFITAIINYSA
ncbi:hypothetical protein E5D57_002571 [Metarhizium anisopliae]|nr:hypothetical protein E5D57_002571 [Metarhizium anisopliae]